MNGTNGNEPGYPENALVPYPVIVVATKTDRNSKAGLIPLSLMVIGCSRAKYSRILIWPKACA